MLKELVHKLQGMLIMHKNEQRGIAVLLSLIVLLCLFIYYQHEVRDEPKEVSIAVQEHFAEIRSELKEREDWRKAERPRTNQPVALEPFDPNTLEESGWIKLGFSRKQSESIVKYRRKGGVFRVKRDVAKLYVIDDEKYSQLEPYILLPEALAKKKPDWEKGRNNSSWKNYEKRDSTSSWAEKPKQILDLNAATLEELESLPYIGPKTAAQIISFRDLLGGFHSATQLEEVYYLRDKPEAVEELLKLVQVTEGSIRQIPVNECEAAALADHPLITWKQANAVVNYRTHHGDYQKLEDVKNCKLISDELFRKIAPYLTTE